MAEFQAMIRRVATLCRKVSGMPDYAHYLAHCAETHPGCEVKSEREYFEEYLASRYEGGPTRCC